MKQQHNDIDIKTYEKGINSDTNKEILGSKEGEHVDAMNMRSIPMDGDNFAKKKVKGEDLLYDQIDNRCFIQPVGTLSSNYECMMSQEINGHIVEIWANKSKTDPPFIRVNGKIVLMSEDFPVRTQWPLQYDKNESCVGGEFYVTNNNTPPMVFSLKDLMMNSAMTDYYPDAICTQKYFDEFNLEEYVIDISSPLYKPMFINQDPSTTAYPYNKILGSLGLPVGSYSYSYRYVTQQGDRGRWSPVTELIPVTRSVGTADSIFPNRRTYSSYPNVASATGYGNHIRIRIENYSNFDFIELRRDCWYTGELIGLPPVSELVGFVDIAAGLSVIDILDRCDSSQVEEILTFEDTQVEMTGIERAKSIRYFNERLYLMNIGYASRDIDAEVNFVPGGDLIFPAIHKMGKSGHKAPYNSTYYKSNMRGDKHGFGIILFDKDGNYSYVKKIPGAENFQFPNRRQKTSTLTNGISYFGTVKAAFDNPSGTSKVGSTHEVFDHENTSYRSGEVYANIFDDTALDVSKQLPWMPLNPTGQTDTVSDYGYCVNTEIKTSCDLLDGEWKSYNPDCFGLNYFSMGAAFKGVDVETLPSWATAFSVVQTPPANRVIAQGLGWYAMVQAAKDDFTSDWWGAQSGKETDKLWVYFPDGDVDCGGVRPQLIDDLLQNYGTGVFKLQAVSPLGYFSEVYSMNNEVAKDEMAEIITYVRIIHDEGQINPTMQINYYPEDQGILSASKQYVGYGAFRANVPPVVYSNNSNGDYLFTITNVQEQTYINGRNNYLIITLNKPIYSWKYGQTRINEFRKEVREWQEPMYVVNIIREEANISDSNITTYNYGGHYQRLKSLIGEGTSQPLQLRLVSERWEDCIRTVPGQVNNAYQSLNRFIWVEDAQLVPKRWMNVTGFSASTVLSILNNLQNFGYSTATDSSGTYQIYGIYKSSSAQSTSNAHVDFFLNFDIYAGGSDEFTIPVFGRKIYVYYDNRIPIRVFCGDTYINESIWAPVDTETDNTAHPINLANEFRWNMAMPYNQFKLSDDYYILKDGSGIWDHLQTGREFNLDVTEPAIVRQWVTMWTAETRTNLSFAFNNEEGANKNSHLQHFPLKNYVMRPLKWTVSNNFTYPDVLTDNKIYLQYYDVYGDEHLNWQFGGFRFKPQTNLDYAKTQTLVKPTTVPQFGFEEQTEYCTRIIWSERRPINVQNSPTVKTFPSNNYYDISDDTGCINFAWSAISADKGNNLYAITQGGVAILLVDKRIIHEINANELATVGSDIGGILNELWIDRNIGMSDETWRSWAEFSNMLFFANNRAVYSFVDNQLVDISATGFNELYRRNFAPLLGSGYEAKLSGGFNVLTKEYIFNVSNKTSGTNQFSTFIYGLGQEALQCQSTYDYDKYLYIDNNFYGMKAAKTYQLGIGNYINGEHMPAYVTGVSDKQIYFDKEFIRIRVNSNSKPDKIYFYDSYKDYINDDYSSVVDATSNSIAIKDYYGYECYIPRKEITPFHRQQGRVVLFKITSTEDEEFLVTSTGVQYKLLK